MARAERAAIWHLFGAFIALAVLVGLPFLLWGESIVGELEHDGLAGWLRGFSGLAWLVAVGLLVSDLLLPIPTTVIIAALGVIYGPLLGGAIALLGGSLAALLGYGLGRCLGRPVLVRLFGAPELAAGERLFARSGGWIVAGSRWLPILTEVVSCMAGLVRMPLAAFALAVLCGLVPLCFSVAALGYAGADRPLLTLAVAAIVPLPLWFLARRLVRSGSAYDL